MGRKYSDGDNEVFKRTVANNRGADGGVDWNNVVALSAVSGKSQTVGAVMVRYSRLMSQDNIKKSSRAGDKTLKRTVKWLEKLVESKAFTELLKKETRELREEIRVLKKELKSHGPILNWYMQAQRGFKIAKAKKALIE